MAQRWTKQAICNYIDATITETYEAMETKAPNYKEILELLLNDLNGFCRQELDNQK